MAALTAALTAVLSVGLLVGPAPAQTTPSTPSETTPSTPSETTPPETTPVDTTPSTTTPMDTTPTTLVPPETTPTDTTPPDTEPDDPSDPEDEEHQDDEIYVGTISTLNGAQRIAVEDFLAATGRLARAEASRATSMMNLAALSAQADDAQARVDAAAWRLALLNAAQTVDRAPLVKLALAPGERRSFGNVMLEARVAHNPRLRTEARREQVAAEKAEARAAGEVEDAVSEVEDAQAAVDAAAADVWTAADALAAVANGDPMINSLLTGNPPPGDTLAVRITAAQAGQGNPAGLEGLFDFPILFASVGSTYGYRIDPFSGKIGFHPGIDIGASQGTPILAAADGTVVVAGREGGYGNAVVLDHGDSLATLYGHMVSVAVAPGQQVAAGDVIGYVGSTGRSTGPHLHFEVRLHGVMVDPVPTFRT